MKLDGGQKIWQHIISEHRDLDWEIELYFKDLNNLNILKQYEDSPEIQHN